MSLLFPRSSSLGPAYVGPARHQFGPLFNLFNDTVNEMQRTIEKSEQSFQSFTPRFDVKEEKDTYLLEGEMPGIEQKDIIIEFSDDHTLSVKGRSERHETSSSETDNNATPALEAPAAEHQNGEPAKTTEVATASTSGKTDVAKSKTANHGPTYWVSERSIGEFKRSFSFPTRIDQDAVKASLKNGILSIVVPKAPKQNTARRVNIE